jgi:hypothetical protein
MIEAVILIVGLILIFAFFFPALYRASSPKAKQNTPAPVSTAFQEPPPDCGDVIVIPSSMGKAPFKVTFVGTGKPTKYPIIGFQWDFDNDHTWDTEMTTQPVEHVFKTPGDYQVQLLVIDEKKNSRICSTTVKALP